MKHGDRFPAWSPEHPVWLLGCSFGWKCYEMLNTLKNQPFAFKKCTLWFFLRIKTMTNDVVKFSIYRWEAMPCYITRVRCWLNFSKQILQEDGMHTALYGFDGLQQVTNSGQSRQKKRNGGVSYSVSFVQPVQWIDQALKKFEIICSKTTGECLRTKGHLTSCAKS